MGETMKQYTQYAFSILLLASVPMQADWFEDFLRDIAKKAAEEQKKLEREYQKAQEEYRKLIAANKAKPISFTIDEFCRQLEDDLKGIAPKHIQGIIARTRQDLLKVSQTRVISADEAAQWAKAAVIAQACEFREFYINAYYKSQQDRSVAKESGEGNIRARVDRIPHISSLSVAEFFDEITVHNRIKDDATSKYSQQQQQSRPTQQPTSQPQQNQQQQPVAAQPPIDEKIATLAKFMLALEKVGVEATDRSQFETIYKMRCKKDFEQCGKQQVQALVSGNLDEVYKQLDKKINDKEALQTAKQQIKNLAQAALPNDATPFVADKIKKYATQKNIQDSMMEELRGKVACPICFVEYKDIVNLTPAEYDKQVQDGERPGVRVSIPCNRGHYVCSTCLHNNPINKCAECRGAFTQAQMQQKIREAEDVYFLTKILP